MLDEPRRLSTDIDIIVDRDTGVDGYIEKAGKIFLFVSVEEHKRKGLNDIEKRHFRFHFLSSRTGKEINILLDVVFEDNPYLKVTERPIRSRLLLSEGEDLMVSLPDKNCILGDKLTAFAPHTTGIPFGVDKELEIIKQLFDCWTLLQEMDDYKTVAEPYPQDGHELIKEPCNARNLLRLMVAQDTEIILSGLHVWRSREVIPVKKSISYLATHVSLQMQTIKKNCIRMCWRT